jgi:hypothetical protein
MASGEPNPPPSRLGQYQQWNTWDEFRLDGPKGVLAPVDSEAAAARLTIEAARLPLANSILRGYSGSSAESGGTAATGSLPSLSATLSLFRCVIQKVPFPKLRPAPETAR